MLPIPLVLRLGFVLALLAHAVPSASQAPVIRYPGLYEYGGDNQLERNFDLYWCEKFVFRWHKRHTKMTCG